MILRRIKTGPWVAATPVTRHDLASLFVRSGHFGRQEFWDALFLAVQRQRAQTGADQLLRRIEYSWNARLRSANSVSWFEADAFARSLGARLPWRDELQAWCSASAEPTRRAHVLFGARRASRAPESSSASVHEAALRYISAHHYRPASGLVVTEQMLGEPGLREWCADHYNEHLAGRRAPPDTHNRRRTASLESTDQDVGIAADHHRADLSFRVVLDDVQSLRVRRLDSDWLEVLEG